MSSTYPTQKEKKKAGRPRLDNRRLCVTMPRKICTGISREACRLGMDRSSLISCLCARYLDKNANLPLMH